MNDEREWYYSEGAGCAQKGPVPAIVLSRLLEKGVGITPQTLIWKAGMETWMPIANVDLNISPIEKSIYYYYVIATCLVVHFRLSLFSPSHDSIRCNGITWISKATSMDQSFPSFSFISLRKEKLMDFRWYMEEI